MKYYHMKRNERLVDEEEKIEICREGFEDYDFVPCEHGQIKCDTFDLLPHECRFMYRQIREGIERNEYEVGTSCCKDVEEQMTEEGWLFVVKENSRIYFAAEADLRRLLEQARRKNGN